jgi:lipopolysaccharide biosynthesis glycosyltransferase
LEFLEEDRMVSKLSKASFYRLFFPKCFPDLKDRILYLDTDTLIVKDLKNFYNSDFENNIII